VNKKVRYYLNKNGEFVIENYHLAKPFSSFFPGIAGLWGIPAWVFYVNRGQGIASILRQPGPGDCQLWNKGQGPSDNGILPRE